MVRALWALHRIRALGWDEHPPHRVDLETAADLLGLTPADILALHIRHGEIAQLVLPLSKSSGTVLFRRVRTEALLIRSRDFDKHLTGGATWLRKIILGSQSWQLGRSGLDVRCRIPIGMFLLASEWYRMGFPPTVESFDNFCRLAAENRLELLLGWTTKRKLTPSGTQPNSNEANS